MSEPEEAFERVQRGVTGFAASMREQGIHVGMGQGAGVRCVCCWELWPCEGSKETSGGRHG